MLKNIKNCSNFTYGLINRVVITLAGPMEGNILDIAQRKHPFISDDYILRDLTVETRKNPGLRIASFIAGFENPENGIKEKIKKLLLCERDCCKVVSANGKKYTNKDVIKECLSGDRGIGSRGNAAQLICNMLRDECQEIKDMAKDIVKEVFCEKNIKAMITNKGPVLTYSWLLSTLVLYGEDLYNEDDGYVRKRKYDVEYMDDILDAVDFLFSEKNIDAVLKNKDFISGLPEVLKGMLRHEKSEKRIMEIVVKLLSEKNIDTVLKNEDFISRLPSALEEMLGYASLAGDTGEIIWKLLSEKNTDALLKNEGFASRLPNMIWKMLRDEDSKEKAADIITELFSSKKVINVLKNEDFVRGLPWMAEELLDNRRLRNKSIVMMEKLFSNKGNSDAVFKNEDFMSQLPKTLEKMLSHTNLAGDTAELIWRLLFVGNIDTVLKNESFMSRFWDIIWEMLRNEGSKEKAADIMEKLFSTKENIGIALNNEDSLNKLPYVVNLMLTSENLKEKTVNIVNKLLGSDAINEQIKSELHGLLICEKLLSEKNADAVSKNEGFMSQLPDMIWKMLRYEGSKEKAADIIVELFSSEKSIGAILKNTCFMRKLPKIIEGILDNRRLRNKSIEIMEKLFSNKGNIEIVLKNEDFMNHLIDTLMQMLNYEDLKGKTINIVNKLLATDAINEQFRSKLSDLLSCEKDSNEKKNTSDKIAYNPFVGSTNRSNWKSHGGGLFGSIKK